MPEWLNDERYDVLESKSGTTTHKFALHLDSNVHSGKLTFRTLSALLSLTDETFIRERLYDMKHHIGRRAVRAADGSLAGNIDLPAASTTAAQVPCVREFVVISRSTIDGKYHPTPDPLDSELYAGTVQLSHDQAHPEARRIAGAVPSRSAEPSRINQAGWFDADVYFENRPWCMFNVLMIVYESGKAYRDAIGRVHVDAFFASLPSTKVIELY
jgi:hypothetical protein